MSNKRLPSKDTPPHYQDDPDSLIDDEEEIMREFAHQEEERLKSEAGSIPDTAGSNLSACKADTRNGNSYTDIHNHMAGLHHQYVNDITRNKNNNIDEGWSDADLLAAASAATDQAVMKANKREQTNGKMPLESTGSNGPGPGEKVNSIHTTQHQQQQQQQQHHPRVLTLRESGCEGCGILSIDNELLDAFGVRTCFACKATDAGLKLMTKSNSKEEFLLNDSQLSSLGSVRKENPRKPGWNAMILFLRRQVITRARQVWLGDEQEPLASNSMSYAGARENGKDESSGAIISTKYNGQNGGNDDWERELKKAIADERQSRAEAKIRKAAKKKRKAKLEMGEEDEVEKVDVMKQEIDRLRNLNRSGTSSASNNSHNEHSDDIQQKQSVPVKRKRVSNIVLGQERYHVHKYRIEGERQICDGCGVSMEIEFM